jgi:hypothetical protein
MHAYVFKYGLPFKCFLSAVTIGGGALAIVPGEKSVAGVLQKVNSSFSAAKAVAFVGNAATYADESMETTGK